MNFLKANFGIRTHVRHEVRPWADPRDRMGNGAEFAVVDRDGNLYGGEPRPRMLRKYVRVRP